jgi:hypothetical protein
MVISVFGCESIWRGVRLHYGESQLVRVLARGEIVIEGYRRRQRWIGGV